MYAVHAKNGRVVARFATRRGAEAFASRGRTARSPEYQPLRPSTTSSGLNRTKMGEARSIYNDDYRFLDPAAVADMLERIAERARRR